MIHSFEKSIEVNNISFTYPDGYKAIKNISFDIDKGDTVGIIGANGSGKSTLILTLLGVNEVSDGEIKILGTEINKKTIKDIRKKIGLVFQNADDQLFMNSVYDNVAFGVKNILGKSADKSEIDEAVEKALDNLELLHLKGKSTFKLSGGEKRRVAIASVLAMKPEIVVLDEPTTGLDPKSRRNLINTLNKLEYTKIVTSHDLDMIMDTCNKIIVIDNGEIKAIGKADEILSDKVLLENCSLELPLSMQNCKKCNGE